MEDPMAESHRLGEGGRLRGELTDPNATSDPANRADNTKITGASEKDGRGDRVIYITPELVRAPNEPADAPLNRTMTTARLMNVGIDAPAVSKPSRMQTAPATKPRRTVRRKVTRKSAPAPRPVDSEGQPGQNWIRIEPPTGPEGQGETTRTTGF
jgi:hypothetical protein